MITNFKKFNLITESPDTVYIGDDGDSLYCLDSDAMPFYIITDHKKVNEIFFGCKGCYHGSIKYHPDRSYPGRLWLDSKIMSFWVYPNETLFKDIIKKIEENLNIKMFNNGWKIEVIEFDGEIRKRLADVDNFSDFYNYDTSADKPRGSEYKIIPIEKYIGSEDVPEEIQIQHLMNWKEKELAKKAGKIHFKGFGSYKTGWDQPKNIRYRQALYQESRKQ